MAVPDRTPRNANGAIWRWGSRGCLDPVIAHPISDRSGPARSRVMGRVESLESSRSTVLVGPALVPVVWLLHA